MQNDLISRSELLKSPIRITGTLGGKYPFETIPVAEIENAPAVDAVSVVRCCNCKHGEFDLTDQGYMEPPACDGMLCHKHNTSMDFTDFCSYGERKEANQ